MTAETYISAACDHPTAQQAVLTATDIARAERHPYSGTRPEWSGYCVIPYRCACACHMALDEIDGIGAVSLGMGLGIQLAEPVESEEEVIIATCGGCGARWTGEAVAHCATCHLTFTSVAGFDDHRDRRGDGRCRTPKELRERGLEPDENRFWRRPMSAAARARIGGAS